MRQILCTYTHRCDNCDYDLCRKCFSTQGKELGASSESSMFQSQSTFFEEPSMIGSAVAYEASEQQASHEAQLRLYEQYRRAQGVSDDRLHEESARLQEELRLQYELRVASEMIEVEEHSTVQPSDGEFPAPVTIENSIEMMPSGTAGSSFEMVSSMPPWCEAPWRTSRQPRPLFERRRNQIRSVYGRSGGRQQSAPCWFANRSQSDAWPPQMQPSPRTMQQAGSQGSAGGCLLPAMKGSQNGIDPSADF